jgi:hypothetical protein
VQQRSSNCHVCACLQATSLRHPFIVPCVESWVVQNHTVNMIYAFCQNGDLSSYLTKVKKQVGQHACRGSQLTEADTSQRTAAIAAAQAGRCGQDRASVLTTVQAVTRTQSDLTAHAAAAAAVGCLCVCLHRRARWRRC